MRGISSYTTNLEKNSIALENTHLHIAILKVSSFKSISQSYIGINRNHTAILPNCYLYSFGRVSVNIVYLYSGRIAQFGRAIVL